MNFSELYQNNKDSVAKVLTSMWCGEANNESQKAYIAQMKTLIEEMFAPKDAIPMVQCMNSYEPVFSVPIDEAEALVGNLWRKVLPKGVYYSPYEHQYQSWKTLLKDKSSQGKPKSIVVTTGTGSGKTECFMLPLVYDLEKYNQSSGNDKSGLSQEEGKPTDSSNNIQAIFLYPLNALMEDQKERLEKLLKGTNLTYTVYNADLPEFEPKDTDRDEDAKRLRNQIELITGGKYEEIQPDREKGERQIRFVLKNVKFERMLYTRTQVRSTPPNILLTNPTMLEYILLRGADAALINPLIKSLRWVVIDETHTYTGAGAAELAMLLRRVLLAFNVNATDIRFATSSATFGNAKTLEEKQDEQNKLKTFISGITGLDSEQVEVIDGKRTGEDCFPDGEDGERWRTIFESEYIELDKLYPDDNQSIEEKLQMLDEMCQREEKRCSDAGKSIPDMRLKVHYFYRVPNNGLFVRLDKHENGAFKIYTENSIDDNSGDNVPLLELSRCKYCGEYVAVGLVNTREWTYEPVVSDDSDMFDLPEDDEIKPERCYYIFGLSNSGNSKGDHNTKLRLNNNLLEPIKLGELNTEEWHIVANTKCCCPYCNNKQNKKHSNVNDIESDDLSDMEDNRLQKFRLSAEFISRIMASSVLDQLDKHSPESDNKLILHDGQQFISFVDSRQAAATATLKQNLEQEKLWFYTTIYQELCRRKANVEKAKNEVARLKGVLDSYETGSYEWENALEIWKKAKEKQKNYITWMEIAELISKNKYCSLFCSLFVNRSSESDELDDGDIKPEILEKYVHSIMVMYLAPRPLSAAAPETLGLFHAYYPQLEKLNLPEEVEKFNSKIKNLDNKISKKDWQNLIQIFMDYTVRSNQSFFLKITNNNNIDIFSSVRFATEKPHRRPVFIPKLEKGKLSRSRIVNHLCTLILRDDNTMTIKDAQDCYFNEIQGVINSLWATINDPNNKLLEQSFSLNENGEWKSDRDNATRFNLVNLSFKLYEDVYLCDSATSLHHIERLRPIENNFKHFSPYMKEGKPMELSEDLHERWDAYPYFSEDTEQQITKDDVNQWAKTNRSLLWNNKLWGEDGIFASHLQNIHLVPNYFIQAEHTAQVEKSVARKLQSDFKDHTVNILACSTTMEMGVDLGNLEVVMLSSVPPMPANYKQRAGRSGRNNKVRSACITLCGSDAIGLRTLYSPIEKIINRKVHVPSVDLQSEQVIKRHVNSFLVREFGVFTDGAHGGSLKQKVIDYYTTYHLVNEGGRLDVQDSGYGEVGPKQKLGDEKGTMYEKFNEKCSKPLNSELKENLEQLLKGTIYEGKIDDVVKNAYETNRRCYSELSSKVEDYGEALEHSNNEKFRTKLKMLWLEVLNERLLNYWATSRFTPNANMPVSILSLDINTMGKKSFYTMSTTSNPSYSLREALAQYAPGNTIVVDGVVYMVRGIESSTLYQERKSFKTIYRNTNKTVIDDELAFADKIIWPVNGKVGLEMITPAGFLPDINEERTRIIDTNVYTHVSSQLIDADDWTSETTDSNLISVRSNKDSGDAKILYYNEGKGYGYCFCPLCGRMVLEDKIADEDDPMNMPIDMNPNVSRRSDGRRYHMAISGKDILNHCSGSSNPNKIKRNVIIGDTIQTDFSEIRIRHRNMTRGWISNRNDEQNLLYTLGIVFAQTLVDTLGKERGAVDFTIMPNGHICIFDTNQGGAGYSNQLSNPEVMKDVIYASEELLKLAKERKSKDILLDKFTLRFIKYIDIDVALNWIEEEKETLLSV